MWWLGGVIIQQLLHLFRKSIDASSMFPCPEPYSYQLADNGVKFLYWGLGGEKERDLYVSFVFIIPQWRTIITPRTTIVPCQSFHILNLCATPCTIAWSPDQLGQDKHWKWKYLFFLFGTSHLFLSLSLFSLSLCCSNRQLVHTVTCPGVKGQVPSALPYHTLSLRVRVCFT